MKNSFILITALIFLCGVAKAQDVYFSGNHNGTGKIWKNNTLVHSISDSLDVTLSTMQIAPDGTVYTAGCICDTTQSIGRIWQNDDILFSVGENTFINRLILNENDWTAAGRDRNGWGINQGVVWHNGEVLYTYSDSIMPIQIHAMCIDEVTGDIYSGGEVDSLGTATVWKNDALLWQAELTSCVCDMLHDGTDLYTCGYYYLEGLLFATAWQNDSIIYSINDLSLTTSYQAIALYEGDLYLAGYVEDTIKVWKNGETLYYHLCDESGWISDLCVNEYGVYYAGCIDGMGTIWKDGEMLYQPEDCEEIVAIAVVPAEPTPVSEVHTLPWFDGFEVDSTWADWAILDFDGNHDIGWERTDDDASTDDFSARHLACDNIQEGWLITPPLYLGIYCDSTWMSFKTKEINPDNYTSSSLLISTTGTQLSDFTEIWSQDNPSETWDSIHIDLSDYQGDTIYLAFKYSGHHGHDWYIDDVNVEEALTLYDIIVESNDPDWGTVNGGGSYPHGDTVTIEATPNTGHQFVCWDDGIVENPRDIVVTQDSTFVALFAINQYTIEVVSDNPAWGSVEGGGTFYYGDTITISATANLGHIFAGWTDGIMDNPRDIIVTDNETYTAHFEIQQCLITTEVNPENSGSVNGGGTYNYGDTVVLTAQNNIGYVWNQWSDGDNTNPRSIIVESDSTFTALFTPLQYEITTEADPVEGGTVSGAGIYDFGSSVTLTATPNENYMFICWSDGVAMNPRTVTVTGNANYKAMFYLNSTTEYTITVVANNPNLGTVSGSGTYVAGTIVEISATPAEGATFVCWDDGSTVNPRSITVTQDMSFKAIFEALTYTITVRPDNPFQGTTYGSGTYTFNQSVSIGATPTSGYYFAGWQDGDMNNPRTIVVTGDAEYVATFSQNPVQTYTVTVYYDETQGFILGAGTYTAGATATIAAIPADGYMFLKWNDGSTDNPIVVVVDHDITLAAFFTSTGVDENGTSPISLYPNPANDKIRIEGLEGWHEICIYNLLGTLVKTTEAEADVEINIDDLSAGFYLIRIDNGHVLKLIKK